MTESEVTLHQKSQGSSLKLHLRNAGDKLQHLLAQLVADEEEHLEIFFILSIIIVNEYYSESIATFKLKLKPLPNLSINSQNSKCTNF